jgi:hypothetical protein
MINFKQTYNRAEFLNFLDKFLPEDFLNEIETINFESNYTRQVTCLGECNSLGIVVFEVQHTSTHDARVALSKEAFRLLYNRSTKNKALVLFVPIDNPETYRFSLVSIDVELDEHKVRKSYSNPRRYSYLLGEGAKVYTPTKYLSVKGRVKDSKDLLDRFSVEVLTKEFYNELFTWYQWALSDEIGVTFPNDRSTESDDRKIEEHLIRLITRLMFVWFIKQKKLVPELLFEVDQLKSLLKNFEATDGKQDTYYRAILQNLFFATLNNKIEERDFAVDGGFYENKVQYGIKTLFRYADEFSVPKEEVIQIFGKVPFLNGGLFECLDKDTPDSNGKIMYSDGFSRRKDKQSRAFIPNILFFDPVKGILSILNKYNFTIEENSPLDIEVALDPELLGKVFENLLGTYNPETKETARKQSGSFYTPREIVQYMVDESLVAHLKRTVGDELEAEYRKLINHTDDPIALTDQQRSDIFKSLKAYKILDPACGSGAFPMGILNRMLAIIERLPIPANISIYDLKLYLIENCIYGIDIQSIAVQISKLRFFISLICEQQPNADSADNYGIQPLPNLETKFVAANTLIGLTPQNAQRNLFEDPQIEVTRNELMQVRHKHFLASTSKQKKECRDEDKKLREKLAHLLDDNGNFAPEDARQLADWNPYDQNTSSPFFDAAWMFGISSDILIQKNNIQSSEISALNLQIEAINKQIAAINYSFKENHEPEILKLQFITANLQVSIIEVELDMIRSNIDKLFGSINNQISNVFKEPENLTYLIKSLNTSIKEVNRKITQIESNLQSAKPIESGGYFDIVIGNPPYGAKFTNEEKKYFNVKYKHQQYQPESYLLFIEKGIKLLASNGILSFIIPNTWLTNLKTTKIRKFIFDTITVIDIVHFRNSVFEAVVDTEIVVFKNSVAKNNTVNLNIKDSKDNYINILQTKFVESEGFPINIFEDNEASLIRLKLANIEKLDLCCKITQGTKPFQVGKGNPKQTREIVDEKEFVSRTRKDESFLPLLRGSLMNRYSILWDNNYWISLGDWLAEPRYSANYQAEEKIIIRQTGDSLIATLDKKQFVVRDNLYTIVPKSPSINLRYILGVINSKLMNWYYQNLLNSEKGEALAQVKRGHIALLPIQRNENQQPFITLVDRILSAKQANPKANTSALESEIDRLVYELYGLTEEEIKIVEGK